MALIDTSEIRHVIESGMDVLEYISKVEADKRSNTVHTAWRNAGIPVHGDGVIEED